MKTKEKNKILKKNWELDETKKLLDLCRFSDEMKNEIRDHTYNDKNLLCVFRLKQVIEMNGGSGVLSDDTVLFNRLDKKDLTVDQKINSKSTLKKFLDEDEYSLPDLNTYNIVGLWPLSNRIRWEAFREGGADEHPKGGHKYYF